MRPRAAGRRHRWLTPLVVVVAVAIAAGGWLALVGDDAEVNVLGSQITAGENDGPLCHDSARCETVARVDSDAGFFLPAGRSGPPTVITFGNPGDFPMMGDWDCDGERTPGAYRRSNGFVYLRDSNTDGVADRQFYLGNPGDLPLAGDFDGDGCDTVSIYRPSQGRFYISNKLASDNQGISADYSFVFGNPGDQPFTGDFDGDGLDTVGLHRQETGKVYLRNTNDSGQAHLAFFYGNGGDKIVAGDWDGNGTDTVAVYRPATGRVHYKLNNQQGISDFDQVVGFTEFALVASGPTLDPGQSIDPEPGEGSTPGGGEPAVETCETVGVQVDDLGDVRDAESGSVLLLRGGVYKGTLRIPAGSPGSPTIVKPYGCETVEIRGQVVPDSWTVVAGLSISAKDDGYTILMKRRSSEPLTNVVIRNNVIRGGEVEAIRIAQNVHQVQIVGNDIDGGRKRHVLKVHWEESQWRPSDISIVNNLFHKTETGSGTDLIQLEGHHSVHIEGNTFENGANENAVDVKSRGGIGAVTIIDNYFDGTTFPSACLLVQGDRADNYVADNYFDNGCGVALGAHPEQVLSPSWRFEGNTIIDGELKIRRSFDAEFIGNTMEGGSIKLGLGGDDYPRDAVIVGNTFNGVEMIDRVTAAGGSYTCADNDLTGARGDWGNC